ncbi:hypothetical protein AB0G74_15100 [Streptomyces sp. NPDC020875]|uniref:hypothetical protein n=1 Tax=Streptomyces sp. NPDC020875 TaxID=3154898 RepID=UPI0033D5874D
MVAGRVGRVDLESAGHTHEAVMDVEVWNGEPPGEAPGEWDVIADTRLYSLSGELDVWGMTGPIEETVLLGREGVYWRVRVRCAGRAEVARLAALGVPEGVERWLVQFWPDAIQLRVPRPMPRSTSVVSSVHTALLRL